MVDNIFMKYSLDVKNRIRTLRRSGNSFNEIRQKTGIAISTINSWVSDIKLTEQQTEVLKSRSFRALQQGKKNADKKFQDERKQLTEKLIKQGMKEVNHLSDKEFFLVGAALYWAEGFKNKHERRLGFCNSDPSMVRFYIHWLRKSLKVKRGDLKVCVTINRSYKTRIEEIEKHWSKETGISLKQFTKPFYQNSSWKKSYGNTDYFGVLRIHVNGSLELLLKMRGWIDGLRLNLPG